MFWVLILGAHNLFALTDTYPKNPDIDMLHYRFELTLSDQTDEITGKATVDFRLKKAGIGQLRLDLINQLPGGTGMRVADVSDANGVLTFTHQNNELLIALRSSYPVGETLQVSISYSGIPAEGLQIGNNKYGDRGFFSDNWPIRARHWLPVVDHPYDKATCEFLVTAPAHYQVVSNGLKLEETNRDQDQKLTHWKQSVPIAPWLFVLGVAEFAVQYVDEFDGKSIQTWVFKQDRDAGFYDFAEPTKHVLEFYSDHVGPYSYEKLANVQSNSVSGGMESASAIFYDDDVVTGVRSERWRNVIIHEIAHQWFGNSVTEYDWDDVWLSEGFATYFTLLFIEHAYGRDAFVEGLLKSKESVLKFQHANPEYTIIHKNLSDMSQVLTNQIYQKGAWTLHMLRGVVGTEAFWQGIRQYYRTFRDANATTADFRRIMEEVSGQDLEVFFQQWLYNPGTLQVSGTWRYDAKSQSVILELEQTQTDGSLFQMPIEVALLDEGGTKVTHRITLREKVNRYEIKADAAPADLVLDPNHWVLLEGELKRL